MGRALVLQACQFVIQLSLLGGSKSKLYGYLTVEFLNSGYSFFALLKIMPFCLAHIFRESYLDWGEIRNICLT